jgi:hypothetical protein
MFESERQLATFDKQHLANIIYGGQDGAQKFLKRQAVIDNDPILQFDPSTIGRSREELLNIYARKLIRYTDIMEPGDLKLFEKSLFFF